MTHEIQRHSIAAKLRTGEFIPVLPSDFALGPGTPVSPDSLLSDPCATLYAIEPDASAAYFVITKKPLDPNSETFFYQAQYREAQAIVSMPIAAFHRVARDIEVPPERLAFVHSTGRAGSTLVSRVLGAAPNVLSYSEPDVLTRVTHFRPGDGSGDRLTREFVDSSIRWLFKEARQSGVTAVMKFRSQVVELADLMAQAFPGAPTLFLYRNAVDWLESFLGSLLRDVSFTDEENHSWEEALAPCHPLVKKLIDPGRAMSPAKLWTLEWISSMERCLDLIDAGNPLLPVRFETLNQRPRSTVNAILQHLKLPAPDPSLLEATLKADSQAGTGATRREGEPAHPLSEAYRNEAVRLIAQRPRLRSPDVILPGTFA